ncbi:MAG: hypothetical protein AAF184_21265 [Pseudomonadota bacterium]
MNRYLTTLAAATALLGAAAAHAATVEFNFADGLGNREGTAPVTYTDSGITLTAEGFAGEEPRIVHINGETGLGVVGNTPAFEGNRIGPGESLLFTFSQPVALERLIAFDEINISTPLFFAILVDGVQAGVFDLTEDVVNVVSLDVSSVGVGTAFQIVGLSGDEGFRVTALRAATVPVPPALALFAGALLVTGAARRRRAQA